MKILNAILLALSLSGALAAEPPAVVEIRPHAVALTFPADGVVEAVQQSLVAAQVPGRIVAVQADAGAAVRKGDLLMRIDAREATEAAAAAEAQYRNAKVAYERTRNLVQQKFMSQAALDKAKADFDAAAAARNAAGAAQSHAAIVAPITGVIARRHAELGEMAVPGKPLFTLFAPGGLRVTASVPQYRLREVRSVKAAKIQFPELNRWVPASKLTLLPMADAVTHVLEARADLPNQPEAIAGLTPGMYARVHFIVGEAVKLTVPAAAVVRRGEVAAVYVQQADGKWSLRQLRLGEAVGDGEIEVLAGLSAGEKIAADPVRAAIDAKVGK
ncbi:MAG: efflux RND transporter periplasmic adaptor subunit [Betaproteobacteria bacterium]